MKIIKKLVNKGTQELDRKLLNELYSECKTSPEQIGAAFNALLKELEKSHSQVRFASVQLLDNLFHRSATFRGLLLASRGFRIIELGLATDTSSLPPPFLWACRLERLVVQVISSWHQKFFSVYPQLNILFDHMRNILKGKRFMDQVDANHVPEAIAIRTERSKKIKFGNYLEMLSVFDAEKVKIREHLSQLQECMNILIPDIYQDAAKGATMEQGAMPVDYRLVVEIQPKAHVVTENNENSIVFDSLRENRSSLLAHQKAVDLWLTSASQVEDKDPKRHENFIKDCIDFKVALIDCLAKARELLDNSILDQSDDEDFEEIDESYQLNISVIEKPKPSKKLPPVVQTFTGLAPVFKNPSQFNMGKRKIGSDVEENSPVKFVPPTHLKEIYEKAPIVEYGDDLEYWGKSSLSFDDISKHGGMEFKHRYLGEGQGADKLVSTEVLEQLKKRTIIVDAPVELIEYPECRAPLLSGKLCKRRDMKKCPFHGEIRPRDTMGILIDLVDAEREKRSAQPIWKLIESQVPIADDQLARRKRRTLLDEIFKPKKPVKERLLVKSNRLSKNSGPDIVQEMKERDKKVFKW
jgi:hypothetical protein